jgi:Rap1a immunity proteins
MANAMANDLPAGSVGDLLDNCDKVSALSPSNVTFGMGLCIGFVDAVFQSWRLRNVSGNNGGICLPTDFTEADTIRVFVSWAKARPQSRQVATVGILDALRDRYPCK